MMTILFIILMFAVFGPILYVALEAAWGIMKVIFTFVFLPIVLILMVFYGLIRLALPILVIFGGVMLIRSLSSAE